MTENINGKMGRAKSYRIRPWMVVLALCLTYLVIIISHYGNVMELVRPGSLYAGDMSSYSRDPEGYDGQLTTTSPSIHWLPHHIWMSQPIDINVCCIQ